MAWKGPLRNAESRLDVLKFNQREELEALQLTSRQWLGIVDRYSPELSLRRIRYVKIDLVWRATFYFGETNYPEHSFNIGEPGFITEDFGDYNSAEFDAKVANNVRVVTKNSKCTRLKHCFIEWLSLLVEGACDVVQMDFGTRFCVWIKALHRLEADVRVQTLEVIDPCYKVDMGTVYRQLESTFRVQEYAISKESTDVEDERQGDELRVDVVRKAKRVSILEYYCNDRYYDDEADNDEDEDNVEVVDRPDVNGSMENVLDFVFSAPECEELYVTVEGDGSGLISKLIRRFQELRSTSQMVSTFTWKWGRNYEWTWSKRNDYTKPIAEDHPCPFKDVAVERRRRQIDPKVRDSVVVGELSGDVYEFRNEHDGTYLTVVIAEKQGIAQFRKGRFDAVE